MQSAKSRSHWSSFTRVAPRAILLALVLFAGFELGGPRVFAPRSADAPPLERGAPTSRPAESPSDSVAAREGDGRVSERRVVERRGAERRGAERRGAASATDPVHGALYRQDVYRAIRASEDLAAIEALSASLIGLLGEVAAPLLAADFQEALENDEPELIAGCAFLLTGFARESEGGPSPLDDEQLDAWIDFFALSDAAAAGVSSIFFGSERIELRHFESILAIWRAGLRSTRQGDLARQLMSSYGLRTGDAEPFLELLDDPDLELQKLAVVTLCRIDSARYLPRITEFADDTTADHRSQLLTALAAVLPEESAADVLLEWHERWPGTLLSNAWLQVGYLQGGQLMQAYRQSGDAKVRKQVLIGWSGQSSSPQRAEQFLTEVYDTDPDPAVRAQSLLALGQIDHARARARLAEAMQEDLAADPVFGMHLSGGVRNALHFAPTEWVDRFALPYAKRRIRGVNERERTREKERWRSALVARFPDRARQLMEEVSQ